MPRGSHNFLWSQEIKVSPITREKTFYKIQFIGKRAKGWISKRVFQENKARQIFRKTNISFPLIRTPTCAYQGARNVRFFGKFGVLWFLETPVLRFALLPYYQRISNTLIYCHSALIIFGLVSVWSPITRDKGPASLNFAG